MQPKGIKVSELARRSGVSVATVHFYIREGLLPRPTCKTSRNMAYYDESLVERIRFIRRLQEQRHLPLKVIHSLLSGEGSGDEALYPSLMQLETLALPSMDREIRGETLTRSALLSQTGIEPDDLTDLIKMGILTPITEGTTEAAAGAKESFYPVDVAIVETIAHARKMGFSRNLFPASDLALYQHALSRLLGEEVPLLAKRLRGSTLSVNPEKMLHAAIYLMGQLLLQLRRKLILDLVAELSVRSRG
jgi:DNA-binding transcriptional MerR regulator